MERVALGDDGLVIERSPVAIAGRGVPLLAPQPPLPGADPRQIKQAAPNFVSTFICWGFHELAPGDLRFHRTNQPEPMFGFLAGCAAEGLGDRRPGRDIDAEWATRGPPPDVRALERLDPAT
jgi:hypothetical protein